MRVPSTALRQRAQRPEHHLQTPGFLNIGRSRHRGIEAGARIEGPHTTTLFANCTLQAVTPRLGENAGRQLKAIPHHFISAGVSGSPADRVSVGTWVTRAGSAWLDDANTLRLPAWTRMDARLSIEVAGSEVYLEVRNLLDREYSTTGFPDPGGTDVVFYRPAAGRTLSVGIGVGG